MRPSNGLSPYPILASFRDDYQDSTFSTSVDCLPNAQAAFISCKFELHDDGLRQLIDQGGACYLLHLECGVTSFRKAYRCQVPVLRVHVPLTQIADSIDVCTYVVATQDLPAYANSAFHPDYGNGSFAVHAGGILAIGDSYALQIEETGDTDVPPSLIRVVKGDSDKSEDVQVNTDGSEYIVVRLNPRTYDLYLQEGNGPLGDTVFSLILLPVLQTVLSRMAADEEDADKSWYRSIEELIGSYGIAVKDIDQNDPQKSPMAVAQKIFEDPVARALEAIMQLQEAGNED